jgi:hypothetical protein
VSQTIAPIRTSRRHRTLPVGAVRVDSFPAYGGSSRVTPGRPVAPSCNEALFPDRMRSA